MERARYGDLGGLREAGAEKGIEITEGYVRLAELAIFKKAYRTLKDAIYQSKIALLLRPSSRPHVSTASSSIWHLEEKAGASIVVTGLLSLIDECINFRIEDIKFKPNEIAVDPPKEVMDKLMQIRVLLARLRRGRLHPRRVQHASGAGQDRRGLLEGLPTRWSPSPTAASRATAAWTEHSLDDYLTDERTPSMADIKDKIVPYAGRP